MLKKRGRRTENPYKKLPTIEIRMVMMMAWIIGKWSTYIPRGKKARRREAENEAKITPSQTLLPSSILT